MAQSESSATNDGFLVGYLVITHKEGVGYSGGYLCADGRGVPVEFRHTPPVAPTRFQEVLYGKTLRPELLGGKIGAALLSNAGSLPAVLLTDEEAVFDGFQGESTTILHVLKATDRGNVPGDGNTAQLDAPGGPVLIRWRSGDATEAAELVNRLDGVDILEPFERARKVLAEVQTPQ